LRYLELDLLYSTSLLDWLGRDVLHSVDVFDMMLIDVKIVKEVVIISSLMPRAKEVLIVLLAPSVTVRQKHCDFSASTKRETDW